MRASSRSPAGFSRADEANWSPRAGGTGPMGRSLPGYGNLSPIRRQAWFRHSGVDLTFSREFSRPGVIGDASRGDVRIAHRLAPLRRLASVNVPGQAIDQPRIVFKGTFHAD